MLVERKTSLFHLWRQFVEHLESFILQGIAYFLTNFEHYQDFK
jgi:hypothetical protein